jgi:type II secretory pathway component GspD/PulD (secretin)
MIDVPQDLQPAEPFEPEEDVPVQIEVDQPQPTVPPQQPVEQPAPPPQQPAAQPAPPSSEPEVEEIVPITPQPPQPKPTPEPRPSVSAKPPGAVVTKNQIEESGGVFNFDDADVYSVIQTVFGDILKVNYIIDQSIQGRVNFRSVAPVAKRDILPLMEVILRLNGIGIVEAEGLYRIVPIGDLPKEPTPVGLGREVTKILIEGKALVQIVPVRYVESAELVRVLTPFLSKEALIVDVAKINHIVIVDTDSNVRRLLQLVEIFDSEELREIKPQVFVYPVQNSNAKDIADMLKQIFLGDTPKKSQIPVPEAATQAKKEPVKALTPVAPGMPTGVETFVSENTRIFPDEKSNSIIILATPDDYALIAEAIKRIDVVPRQVLLEAIVAEITLSDDLEFGLAWFLNTNLDIADEVNLEEFTGRIGFDQNSISGVDVTSLANFVFAGVDSGGVVRALLESLAADSRANILHAPHILVSDNREATIRVGDQVPIATSETNISGTSQIQRTIQYRDTGIIFKVKPQVNEGGLVALDISQEVSAFRLEDIFDSTQVVITSRSATTNLVVQDNQTIIIGGLIKEDVQKTRRGIPLLYKIPLLGYLFGNTTENYVKTELIMLLTPHVIRNQQEADSVSSQFLKRLDEVQESVNEMKIDLQVEEDTPMEQRQHPHGQ